MLCCEDHAGHPCITERFRPLVRVQVCRIEHVGRALAPTPLFVRKSVMPKMHEGVVFEPMPRELSLTRSSEVRRWRRLRTDNRRPGSQQARHGGKCASVRIERSRAQLTAKKDATMLCADNDGSGTAAAKLVAAAPAPSILPKFARQTP